MGLVGVSFMDTMSVRRRELSLVGATLALILLASDAVAAQEAILANGGPDLVGASGFITKEWTWPTETGTTTFTAFGPVEEVLGLDPRDRTPFCEGCELASSTQFEPEDETASD